MPISLSCCFRLTGQPHQHLYSQRWLTVKITSDRYTSRITWFDCSLDCELICFCKMRSKDGFFPPCTVYSFLIQPFSLKKWLGFGGQFLLSNCCGSTNTWHSLNQIPCPCSVTTCVLRDLSTWLYCRYCWEVAWVKLSWHSRVWGKFPMLHVLKILVQTSQERLGQGGIEFITDEVVDWLVDWWGNWGHGFVVWLGSWNIGTDGVAN